MSKLTQHEFAERLGLSYKTVSRALNGYGYAWYGSWAQSLLEQEFSRWSRQRATRNL